MYTNELKMLIEKIVIGNIEKTTIHINYNKIYMKGENLWQKQKNSKE